jgi:hypothetical protein
MNKLIVLLIVTASIILQPGCTRKGDDDPALSLRTRKARLVGKWKLETAEGTYSELRVNYEPQWKYAFGTETCFSTSSLRPNAELHYSSQLEFTSDEKFEWVMKSGAADVGIMKGSWHFLHDGDRSENKSQLILFPESISGTWPNGLVIQFPIRQQSPVFTIDELRHKKIVLSRNYQVDHIGSPTGLPITGSETFRFVPR